MLFSVELQLAVLAIMTTSKENLILAGVKIPATAVGLMKLCSGVTL